MEERMEVTDEGVRGIRWEKNGGLKEGEREILVKGSVGLGFDEVEQG